MQHLDVSIVGYCSTDDLVVLCGSVVDPQVYIGTGKDPLENLFQQKSEDTVPSTAPYGMCEKRKETTFDLDGGMHLVHREPSLGQGVYLLDDKPIYCLPRAHFTFLWDATTSQLHVGRADREIKFKGSLQGTNNTTHMIITGVRDYSNWARSAEIFISVAAAHARPTSYRRLWVKDRIYTSTGMKLVTDLGTLSWWTKERFARAPQTYYHWNGTHLIKEGDAPANYVLRNEEGFIY